MGVSTFRAIPQKAPGNPLRLWLCESSDSTRILSPRQIFIMIGPPPSFLPLQTRLLKTPALSLPLRTRPLKIDETLVNTVEIFI